MRLTLSVAVVALAVAPLAAAATAAHPSLCRQLAARVAHSRKAVGKSHGSLKRWISLATAPDWPLERGSPQAAVYQALRHALAARGLLTPRQPAELHHLAGTRLYMVGAVAGSAECQSAVFAEVDAHGTARLLSQPEGYTAPCWNVHGALGRVLGHPAYVESGTVSMTDGDTLARVTPWTGAGWGRVCQLTVRLRYRFVLARRFCGGSAACGAAQAIAVDVARAYRSYRHLPRPPRRSFGPDNDVADFSYQPAAVTGPAGSAAVTRAWHIVRHRGQAGYPGAVSLYGVYTSVFPTFGAKAPNSGWNDSFSYVDFAMFPVRLDGHLYLGAVGYNGVGWREGADTLFALYEAPLPGQRRLAPVAGFDVASIAVGVQGTSVVEGAAALPPRPGM
jgi:hypothetical protein